MKFLLRFKSLLFNHKEIKISRFLWMKEAAEASHQTGALLGR
jgi:hypothetical protein